MGKRITFGNVSPNDHGIHDTERDRRMEKWEQDGEPNTPRKALHLDTGRNSTKVKVSQKTTKMGI